MHRRRQACSCFRADGPAEGRDAGAQPAARVRGPRMQPRVWTAATIVLALIVTALVTALWRRAPAPAPAIRYTIAPPPGSTFYEASPVHQAKVVRRSARRLLMFRMLFRPMGFRPMGFQWGDDHP